jgi:hypothetical protein
MVLARGVAFATVVAALQTAAAAPCPPRAHLDGDAEAVARVGAALEALGIVVDAKPSGGCPVVVAAVEFDRGGGIAVAVRDGTNRSEGRVVSDAALAAAWIDSWIHDDFAPAPLPAAPVTAPGIVAARVDEPPVPAPSLLDRFAVDVGYVQSFAFDGSGGSGVSGAACVKLGALCVGARVIASSLEVPTGITRDDVAVTATASWSTALGRMVIAPEAGIGAGRMTTDACPPPPPCDPTTMMCQPAPPCDSAGVHGITYTPRLAATLRASVPLFDHVWLDGVASLGLAPLSHTGPLPGPMPDASGMVMPGSVPGEPDASLQLGVGVRVGLP